jgi:signal transduction histidine kinase
MIGPDDAPVAALVHDPALLERRALLAATASAARLALENERLQAELLAQLAELRVSRARIVSAGDEERRRLERDLHDGAQQRLLSLGLALQLARGKLGPEANGAAELLDRGRRRAARRTRRVARACARHPPAVLTEHGWRGAARTRGRSPVPVAIGEVPSTGCRRPPKRPRTSSSPRR